MAYEIVVVGTSWGGLAALRELITGLPAEFELPLVVVQHRHRDSHHLLTTLLQDETKRCVCEIEDKAPITARTVNVAPADYHLLIEDGYFSLSTDEPVRYSRPSIDVTFVSAADTYGDRVAAVVLTGANADGARGAKRVFDRGGLVFVQLPATAESPTMPAAALSAVPQARSLTIREIVTALGELPHEPPRVGSASSPRTGGMRR